MPIQILAPDVAAKIAAGEVVERPANVAKELIENSLDAGATEIRIDVREGGARLLRVTDNGRGIAPNEAPIAFERHATSKVTDADDLNRIATLGFRGEALYSIAAVSHAALTTRTVDEDAAVQMRLEGGDLVTQSKAGAPVGTSISVEHLFFNVPARKKFLRKPATEAGRISALVQRYALAYPSCRFTLTNDGKETFRTNGSGNLYDVLMQIRGIEQARQMIAFGDLPSGDLSSEEDSAATDSPASVIPQHEEVHFMPEGLGLDNDKLQQPLRVSGYTSMPSLTRANRVGIDLFVNRRYVEDRSLTHAVVQAYHTLLPVGRFPMAIVLIELDPSQVDVNVHPQKTQIRFVDERAVYSAVQRAVREAIVDQAPVPDMHMQTAASTEGHHDPQQELDAWRARREQILKAGNQAHFDLPTPQPFVKPPLRPAEGLDDAQSWQEAEAGARAPESPQDAGVTGHETEPTDPSTDPTMPTHKASEAEKNQAAAESTGKLPPLRVVGQVGALYIIAEGPQGVFLIDQHAAHERILYEQFMAQRRGSTSDGPTSQHVLEPLTLHMGANTTGLVAQHLDELNNIGFQIEPFGGDSFLLQAVPAVLSGQDPQRLVEEIVTSLGERRDLVGEEKEARLVKMVCKRAAIKAGQQLSAIEIRELVRQLESCESPRTCPHGRPTMIQLSAGELEKAFGRL